MPSKTNPYRHLMDIRTNIGLAQKFVNGLTYETFCDDQLAFYAVTRCLEIISEAPRRLPDELKARYADIPWKDVAGAGNVYRHDYEDVQHKLIWGTVHNRLPVLLAMTEEELPKFSDPPL